jgi:flagellar basal body P-ring protein FlgI
MPYASVIEASRKLGGTLVVGNCKSEDDVLALAQGAAILLLS